MTRGEVWRWNDVNGGINNSKGGRGGAFPYRLS
jgi:hypothetical protein